MATTTLSPKPESPPLEVDDQPSISVSVADAMNPRCRNGMEDVAVVHAPGTWGADYAYLGVYDGHGGRDMVDFLKNGLSFHIAQELNDKSVDLRTRLTRAFLMADIHSHQAGVQYSGAAVAVCLVQRDALNPQKVHLVSANAGDARVVWGSPSGKAQRLSHDHRIEDPLELARIHKAGGFVLKERVMGVLAVTRSLGDHVLKDFVISHPHVNEVTVEGAGVVIIACDGLWDVVTDEEAVDFVHMNYKGSQDAAAEGLVQLALERKSTDNITAIVVWL